MTLALTVWLTASLHGQVMREYWLGIPGSLSDLTSHPSYPDEPTGSDFVNNLEATSWTDPTVTFRIADEYGQRLRGYITAPSTGTYTFWIASDNRSQFWLSSDSSPNNIALVAECGWAKQYEWNRQTDQKSETIVLTAGERYYFEVIHKERYHADHMAVGWAKPGEPTMAPSEVIPQSVLTPFSVPDLNDEQLASRFLQQTTFGPTDAQLAAVTNLGFEGWLDDQFTKGQFHAQAVLDADYNLGNPQSNPKGHKALLEAMAQDQDPLRQRVAYALSQIFVVNDTTPNLIAQPRALTNFYDMLGGHAFGNFRNLLEDVTFHPVMGIFLSHLGNKKADPNKGTNPDENYAREIMQLFSIGLFMLNEDGSFQLDGNGAPIPTYTNEAITNFARVFTGLTYATNDNDEKRLTPMQMVESNHDFDAKTLLTYDGQTVTIAAKAQSEANALEDVDEAIDCLFNHPNTGPFISRLLIQHLVTSNPTSGYISRVSSAFADNGQGVRGDMKAVIKAIFLDEEARDLTYFADVEHGRAREAWLKYLHLTRSFNYYSSGTFGLFEKWDQHLEDDIGMRALGSPSVFTEISKKASH